MKNVSDMKTKLFSAIVCVMFGVLAFEASAHNAPKSGKALVAGGEKHLAP